MRECLSAVEVHGDGDSWNEDHRAGQPCLLGEDGMFDLRGFGHVASTGDEDCSVHGSEETSSAA